MNLLGQIEEIYNKIEILTSKFSSLAPSDEEIDKIVEKFFSTPIIVKVNEREFRGFISKDIVPLYTAPEGLRGVSLFPIKLTVDVIEQINAVLSGFEKSFVFTSLEKPILSINGVVHIDFSEFRELAPLAIQLTVFLGGLTLYGEINEMNEVLYTSLIEEFLFWVPKNIDEKALFDLKFKYLRSMLFLRVFLNRCLEDEKCSNSHEVAEVLAKFLHLFRKVFISPET